MKIGNTFSHYPTNQRGIVKGHLDARGSFRALLADGTVRRVKLAETSLQKADKPNKRRTFVQQMEAREVIEARKAEARERKASKMQKRVESNTTWTPPQSSARSPRSFGSDS